MNSTKRIALSVCFLLLISCSTVPTKKEPKIQSAELIAQDFVNTMVQIEGLSPGSTVLQFDADILNNPERFSKTEFTTDFGRDLKDAASDSGYSVQILHKQSSALPVRFRVTEATDGSTFTYDVSVGDVDFRRVYKPLTGGGMRPHKAMLVRGADVSAIQSDDSIFYMPETPKKKLPLIANKETVGTKPAERLEIAQSPTKLQEPVQQQRTGFDSPFAKKDQLRRLERQSPESLAVAPAALPQTNTLSQEPSVLMSAQRPEEIVPFAGIGKKNLAESGTSNYEGLLATKQNVAEEILIFGDDSYILGVRNKRILGQIMNSFNPETDVVSIVGCSTGATKIENGNAALAIGRANRVKEALLYSGVPHDQIFDEGCWSPNANSTPFPNRGVVITVKRELKNS